jgi:hypothetical protein
MPRRDSDKIEGNLFVGQKWFNPKVDPHWPDGSRYVVCNILKPPKDVASTIRNPHLRCSLLSLNDGPSWGLRLNGIHSEESLRRDGYLPDGFMMPYKVKGIEDAKRTNKLPQHVIDAWKDKRARDWAAMCAEQGVAVDVNFRNAESLAKKAEIDAQGEQGATALMFAARNGHLPVVETLVKNGAKLDLADNKQQTALVHAKQGDHEPVIELLIAAKSK